MSGSIPFARSNGPETLSFAGVEEAGQSHVGRARYLTNWESDRLIRVATPARSSIDQLQIQGMLVKRIPSRVGAPGRHGSSANSDSTRVVTRGCEGDSTH